MKRIMNLIFVILVIFGLMASTVKPVKAFSTGFTVGFKDVFEFSAGYNKTDGIYAESEFSLFGLYGFGRTSIGGTGGGETGDSGMAEYEAMVAAMQEQVGTSVLTNNNELVLKVPYVGYVREGNHKLAWDGDVTNNGTTVTAMFTKKVAYNDAGVVRFNYETTYPVDAYYKEKGKNTWIFQTDGYYGKDIQKINFNFVSEVYRNAGIVESFKIINGGASNSKKDYELYTLPSYVTFYYKSQNSNTQTQITHTKNDIQSRPGSVAAEFGYVDAVSGDEMTTGDIQIVNETDNSVYNPVTDNTYNYTDWNYDYSTRTYDLTLDNSEKVYVTYGDDYMTITESNTVYNVYYYIDSGGTTEPTDPTDPTDPPDEPTDPTDPTDPGDDGGDDDDGGSIWDIIGGILGKLVETITSLVLPLIRAIVDGISKIFDIIGEGLTSVVDLIINAMLELPRLFTGFTEFLSAVFPFMPPEFTMVIMFGLLAMIAAGIIKRFLG